MSEHPQLGGTDGVRGLALEPGLGNINAGTVAGLTYALTDMQISRGEQPLVVIGRDTRPSGPELERAAVAGAVAAGAQVLRLGVAPTPVILKTAQMQKAGAAISLTASHNDWPENGWKGTLGEDKPFGPQVKEISDRFWAETDSGLSVPLSAADSVPERPDLQEAYVNSVIADMELQFGDRPLEGKVVVVDGANGATMHVTPKVLERLGATVHTFACDGERPINDGTGATNLDGVKDFMRRHPEIVRQPGFIGAVAKDGDGDRFMGVGASTTDQEMEFVDIEGNRTMELLAKGQPGTIGTHYTNDAMVARLRAQGTGFEFCENGDVYVTAALRATAQTQPEPWTRGGEFTGHQVDLSWLSSGDGVRTAALTACLAAQQGTTFYEMGRQMPLLPQSEAKIKLPPEAVQPTLDHPDVQAAIAGAKAALAAQAGRALVRASGTEKGVIRLWSSGEDGVMADAVVASLKAIIKRIGLADSPNAARAPAGRSLIRSTRSI
jgi:phosphoglucosamine mutase